MVIRPRNNDALLERLTETQQRRLMRNARYWEKRVKAEYERSIRLADKASAVMYAQDKRVYGVLKGKLEKLLDAADAGEITATNLHNAQRYLDLMATIRERVPALGETQEAVLENTLNRVYDGVTTGNWYKSADGGAPSPTDYVIDDSALTRQISAAAQAQASPIAWDVVSDETRQRVVNANWSGKTFKSINASNNAKLQQRLQALMEDAILAGQRDHVYDELQRTFGMYYHEADRLVRTECAHVYNESALERYDRLGVDRVRVLTFFETACETCEAIVTESDDQQGTYALGNEPQLPIHPNCRCCYIPVLD